MFVVPKLWNGGFCFIVGGGTSILKQFNIPDEVIKQVNERELPISVYSDYLKPLHDQHVIGVNMAYRLGDWIDVLIFGDNDFRRNNAKEMNHHSALKVSIAPKKDAQFKWMQRHRSIQAGLTEKPGDLCWNNTTGAAAINLAVQLGVKEIYLLGFDMKLTNQNQHWHKEYPNKKYEDINRQLFNPQTKPFSLIAKAASKLGVKIYNCNPDSAIECFPKITVQQALRKSKSKKERKKKVSVLVTAWKAAETIEETLDSIYAQTYKKIEVLVGIDGCEDTSKKVEEIRHKYKNLKVYYSDLNVGTYLLSNALLMHCKGDYFIRFDSDDIMYPNMVEDLVKEGKDFVRCQFDWEVKEIGVDISTNMFCCGPLFANTNIVKNIGGYQPWRCAADSDLLRRLNKIVDISFLPKKLFKRYQIPTSLTTCDTTGMKSQLRKELHQKIESDSKKGIVNINFETVTLCKL